MSIRLLIADDNEDMANSLSRLLRGEGFEVEAAYNGEQAVERARLFHPDVLILDLCMPVLGGLEVANHLQALPEFTDKIFVAITGYADERHLNEASHAQFDEYLVKPFPLKKLMDLLARVSRHLGQ